MSNRNSTFNQDNPNPPDNITNQKNDSMSVDGELSLIMKESPPNYVTRRDKLPQIVSELRNDFKEFQNTIISTLESYFLRQDDKQSKFLAEFEEMRKSIDFISNKYDDLNKVSNDLRQRVSDLERNKSNNNEQCTRITTLENKLDIMEQQARQCNAEINNLPERRGEDLMALVLSMGSIVKQPITQQDIVTIHRVPQATPNVSKPKNVIVKFTNRIIRDNFLAATRLAKGITTDQLNISGTSQKVYINEHLTLKNKILFREARMAAKEHNFKYIWIKHGTILGRGNDLSPVIAIKCQEDLQKLSNPTK